MYISKMFAISVVFILAFLMGCNTDFTSADENSNTGRLSILLTDAPADYDSVVITFSEISAHIDSDWVHVSVDTMNVDLLQWSNGNYTVLAENDIPAGKYTQVRLKIIKAILGRSGQVYELDVPSGATSGLKLNHPFTISAGSSYELALDFNADKSIHSTGPKTNPHGYKLKPVIRIVSTATSGSISGTVTNHQNLPYAHAVSGSDTIASVYPDTSDGSFMLAFLSEGFYTVCISDTANKTLAIDSVEVIAGGNIDLGNLLLE